MTLGKTILVNLAQLDNSPDETIFTIFAHGNLILPPQRIYEIGERYKI